MFHYLKFFCSCSRQILLVTLIFLLHQLLLLVKAIFSSIDKPWPQKRFTKEVEAAKVAPQQRKPTPNRGPCLSAPSCWGSQSQSQGSGARAVTPPAPSFATSTTTPSRNRATSAVTAIATGRAAAPSATSPSALRTDAAEPRAASPLLQPLLHRHHLQHWWWLRRAPQMSSGSRPLHNKLRRAAARRRSCHSCTGSPAWTPRMLARNFHGPGLLICWWTRPVGGLYRSRRWSSCGERYRSLRRCTGSQYSRTLLISSREGQLLCRWQWRRRQACSTQGYGVEATEASTVEAKVSSIWSRIEMRSAQFGPCKQMWMVTLLPMILSQL